VKASKSGGETHHFLHLLKKVMPVRRHSWADSARARRISANTAKLPDHLQKWSADVGGLPAVDSEGRVSGTGDVPRVDPATLTGSKRAD
jgi:hypothetical protein